MDGLDTLGVSLDVEQSCNLILDELERPEFGDAILVSEF
jgi:hypothetical protein